MGQDTVSARYGNLFEMYGKITGENPYKSPMRIYPAVHYTMGGLWVDYNLMTTIPGLFSIGESNFSDHGANRLGASALMQGLADGYFVLPYTIGTYLSKEINSDMVSTEDSAFDSTLKESEETIEKLLSNQGNRTVESLHKELGLIMWNNCGMSRNQEDLDKALKEVDELKKTFWSDVKVPGKPDSINKAEDRELFKESMNKIGLESARAQIAKNIDQAISALDFVGLPAIIRPSFTLGGEGGGIAYNKEEFLEIVTNGLKLSPTTEVLIEESLLGWKEYEMEVVRDNADNCIIICSIENVDPMGVHTGDSITVAPALTLTDKEYQKMRNASIAVLREIGAVSYTHLTLPTKRIV